MDKRLLVRLGVTPNDPIEWLLWSQDEARALESGELSGPEALSQLGALAVESPCYVLVPQEQVLLSEVQLPNRSRAALDSVPFQLEELLCEEPQTYHFALGEAGESNRYPVAVVLREQIRAWAGWLRDAALPVKGVFADAQVLDVEGDALVALSQGNRLLIKGQGCAGLALRSEELESWRPLLEKSAALNTRETTPERAPLETLAETMSLSVGVNLLQGAFKLRDPVADLLKNWRVPAILGLLLLGLGVGALVVENVRLGARLDAQQAQVNAVYREALPESQRIVNPRVQMERALDQLRLGQRGAPLLGVLEETIPAFSAAPGLSLKGLRYERGQAQLIMELEAPEYQRLQAFNAKLQEAGLASKLGRFSTREGVTLGQVSIEGVL
ncbi:type II secretion system protein GspL [Motiliproteus sp. SC1-56]|uniref:type II secretion system protein GspL n=1 Tax=Motiliproteus sp. SC1-56 TaxID=2799565 RepID=UPI001A8E9D8C|nr:type II secretion system protein GspL [Motiliproteus sp. SC1-56]